MQNIHNVFWPKNNQVWNSALTGLCLKTFQHKGLHQFQKEREKNRAAGFELSCMEV